MTKLIKSIAVESSNVNELPLAEVVETKVRKERHTFENGILMYKGYIFDSNKNELIRKGTVRKNVMPRFHDDMKVIAKKLNLPTLAALCVAGGSDEDTATE